MQDESIRRGDVFPQWLQTVLVIEIEGMTGDKEKVIFAEASGSERGKLCVGRTLKHATAISRSALVLSNTIAAMSQNRRKSAGKEECDAVVHIPYRDSILTRMLYSSLRGDRPTVILGVISNDCTVEHDVQRLCRDLNRLLDIVSRTIIH